MLHAEFCDSKDVDSRKAFVKLWGKSTGETLRATSSYHRSNRTVRSTNMCILLYNNIIINNNIMCSICGYVDTVGCKVSLVLRSDRLSAVAPSCRTLAPTPTYTLRPRIFPKPVIHRHPHSTLDALAKNNRPAVCNVQLEG